MRPDFLTQPGTWIRASRISQTAAEYACPVECRRVERTSHRAMYALVIVTIGLALAGYFGA